MGKKQKKPGKGKEKTERKTAKGEEKRARREARKVGEEDDIDAILRSIQKEEAKKKEVHVEENVPAPSPRSNCSLTVNPLKETELILYGGEFYNGSKTFVYGDLYRYDVEKNEWKLVSSPNSPPPRSAHQTVAWKNNIYMFGGEFTSPNQERFHHYKDFWTLDLKTNQWEQILAKGCPSARSGHRMVLYKHKIVLFGGFYDTLREVRYYNDLHVFDLDHFKWEEIKPRPGCLWPSPRSGFQLAVYQDQIYLYGGYFKEVSSDKEKGTVHADMWSLDPRTWEWNKVKKAGMPPGPRAGFSMCVHKKRAVLFGGVVDMEVEGDVIMSMFMNELYGFQLDNHRWYPLELRKDKPAKTKARNIRRKEPANDLEANVIDNEGDEVMEDSEQDIEGQPEVNGVSNQLIKSLNITKDGSSRSIDVLSDSTAQETSLEAVKPSGRINACMAVGKDMLYLYGGMMEVKDREITLDDLYSLNLSKLDEWKCIISASESEWLEISDEEGDDDDEADDDENEEGDASQTDEDEEESDEDAAKNVSSAVSLLKGESKTMRRKEKRARIEQIRVILGLSDSQRTPVPGESLRDFYKRTNMYWQMAAYEHTQHTGKELRKDGFDLAETRYKELKPILDELAVLEAEQKAEEEASASTSSKKDTKKPKQKSAGSATTPRRSLTAHPACLHGLRVRAARVGAGARGAGAPGVGARRGAPRAVAIRGVPPPGEATAPPLRRLGRRHGRHGRHRPRARVPPRRGRPRGRPRRAEPGQARRRRGRPRSQAPGHPGPHLRPRLRRRRSRREGGRARGVPPRPRRRRARQQRRRVLPVRALLPRGGRGAGARPDTAQRRGRHAGDARRAPRHAGTPAWSHREHGLRRLGHHAVRSALHRLRRHQGLCRPILEVPICRIQEQRHRCTMSGTYTGGDEVGVHQETHLARTVAGHVCPRRRPPHRVRAAVHAVLGARGGVAPHLACARAYRRQDVPEQVHQHPRQGPRQRSEEEGAVTRGSLRVGRHWTTWS